MMEEKEIENLILESSKGVEIKTQAKDILERYKENKRPAKTPWYRRKIVTVGVPVFSLVAIVSTTAGVYFGLKDKGPVDPSINVADIPANNQVLESATYEILAGVSFLGTRDTPTESTLSASFASEKVKRRVQGNLTDTLFDSICSTFEDFRFMLTVLDDYAESGFSYTPVQSDDPAMPYCVMVEGLFIYFQDPLYHDEESFTIGYIENENRELIYDLYIEKETEVEHDEYEVETEVTLTDTLGYSVTVGVSSETEPGEISKEFSLEEKDPRRRTVTEVSFEDETEGRFSERTLEVETLDYRELEWEYTIVDQTEEGFLLAFESDDIRIGRDSLIEVILEPLRYSLIIGNQTYTWPD